jgi:hypothetical protein
LMVIPDESGPIASESLTDTYSNFKKPQKEHKNKKKHSI